MSLDNTYNQDFEHIFTLITDARNRVYSKANSELVLLYFNVGKIVSHKVSSGKWGENTVQQLADFIQSKAPNLSGFNRRGLYRMKQFFEVYTDDQFVSAVMILFQNDENQINTIVSAMPTQLREGKNDSLKMSALPTLLSNPSAFQQKFLENVLAKITWTNHLEILSGTKTVEEKLFYLLGCITEKWGMRELRRQIQTATYERTMLSKKVVSPVATQLPENIFKDPYIFEFLDLPDGHSEKDLEKAIALNLQKFVLEIGKGFTYMGEQYRIQVGNRDYHTDLLFYHRDLQCLVLFELKIEDFEPEFIGKLNFYLEALDRDVKRPHENPSIGILLCKGKEAEVVEYAMARNISPAIVADYQTKLIDKKLLADKLHQLGQILEKSKDKGE